MMLQHRVRLFIPVVLVVAYASTASAIIMGFDPGPSILVVPSDTAHPALPAFTPGELWNMDSKVDDGMPGTGQLVIYGADASTAIPNCTTASDGTQASAATARYAVNNASKGCASVFRNQF